MTHSLESNRAVLATSAPAADSAAAEGWSAAVITDIRPEARGVVSIGLRPAADEQEQVRLDPGAHIDLKVADCDVRQYSLIPRRAGEAWRIAVLDDPNSRGTSQYVHRHVNANDVVQVRGPRNNFALRTAPRYRLIGGGIGITPILAMLDHLEALGHQDWRLLYGGRSRQRMAFLEHLERYGDRVVVWVEEDRGLPPVADFLTDLGDGLVYCCGPSGLLDSVAGLVEPGRLVTEHFSAKTFADAPSVPFTVTLEQSAITLEVPADQTILATAEAAGVLLPTSCGEGTCGACLVPVLSGIPDHRDSVLTAEEQEANDVIITCSSRAKGGHLVLDA